MAESYVTPDYTESEAAPSRARQTPHRQTMLDDVANDLAFWIDDTATKVALAFAPGRAPFSAQATEAEKLEFYRRQLFNPDGSPNVAGRNKEVARVGPEGFGQVYQAVVKAYPELKPKSEPAVMPPPMPMGLPPGPGMEG